MKICLISFDHYGFDYNIIKDLKNRGIEANHIDISKFKYNYTSVFEKCSNFFSKLFLNTNVKRVEMEKFILTQLESLGQQDIILSIRPDRISKKTHLEIKHKCDQYICYLYDSSNLFPIKNISKEIFDKVYTFDMDDSKKYGFKHISNYIYLDKKELNLTKNYDTDLFIVSSIDERIELLNQIAKTCSSEEIPFKFVVVGKKRPKNLHPKIIHTTKNISLENLIPELENSKIFLDLIRENQNGLSFRIFEALSFQKKIITSNASVKDYPFYNPNNFLIIDKNNLEIPIDFFKTPYKPLSQEIYNQFTIHSWVSTVFEID